MATPTKTPARKAASQKSATAAVKSIRARSGQASEPPRGKVRAAAKISSAEGSAGKAAGTRTLNGTPASKATKASGSARARAQRGNGEVPAELAGNVQEFAPDTLHEGEVVRKTRALSGTDAAAPVQVATLAPEVTRPAYWDKACADLVKRDRILKKLIPKFGPVHLQSRGDPFVTLARSVVGQQISVPAAQAVWQRIELACPKLVPQQFLKLGLEKLMACGLSKRKTEYILDLADHFVSGALHVGKWDSMDDEAVIAELTQIRGIGRWTAEMFLIFNLSRPDVLPLDDLGLIRAISVNYFSGEPVTRSEAREVAANWEPWRTVATWYMWRSLDPLPVDY
jgi:DNA-3-methyladenine glycosylase II